MLAFKHCSYALKSSKSIQMYQGATILLILLCVVIGGCGSTKKRGIAQATRGAVPVHGNWCGPGHPKYKGQPAPDPIDKLDAACKRHDQCYTERGYMDCSCDLELLKDIERMRSYSARTIYDYFSITPCSGKSVIVKPFKFLKRQGEELLETGPVYFIFKPVQFFLGVGKTLLNAIGLFGEDDKKKK